MKPFHATILLLFLLVPRAMAADPAGIAEMTAALDKLNTGIRLLEQRSPDAQDHIRESAADLRKVIDEHQIHTPGVYHALGNAYMLLGEHGQAVLAYKRGERIDPTDPRLRDSLKQARAQVQIRVNPTPARRLTTLLMSWRGIIPGTILWGSFVALFTLGWLLLAARVAFAAPRWFNPLAIWSFRISCIPLLALGAEWVLFMGSDQVVLTQSGVDARSGPDDSIYDPVYTEPLSAGVEAALIETRDGWGHLQLADATNCWVPLETFEPVFPRSEARIAQEITP